MVSATIAPPPARRLVLVSPSWGSLVLLLLLVPDPTHTTTPRRGHRIILRRALMRGGARSRPECLGICKVVLVRHDRRPPRGARGQATASRLDKGVERPLVDGSLLVAHPVSAMCQVSAREI